MEIATAKSKIAETFDAVIELSASQQKNIAQQKLDSMLDKIAEFNKSIQNKTDIINKINDRFEQLSWFDNIDDDGLKMIRKTIDFSVKVHYKLIKYYVKYGWTIRKQISTEVMRDFKNALDNMKEHNEDLEDLFFVLPNDPEMKSLAEELAEVSDKLIC